MILINNEDPDSYRVVTNNRSFTKEELLVTDNCLLITVK
jgi:hypothetical protein